MPTTDFGRFEKVLRVGEGRRLKRLKQQAAYIAVLRAVLRGRVPRERLNEAVGRILLAKQDYNLIRR